MKKINKIQGIINSETLIVGVDVGKTANQAIFRKPGGFDSMPFGFTNTKHGFDNFFRQIMWQRAKNKCKRVIVGFESTGIYGEPLLHYLKSKPVKLVMVNPVHTKRVKEIRDNSPNKTDQKDPRVIADLVQMGCVLSVIIPEGSCAELRQLTHARERAISAQNEYISQLHSLVCKIFPEFFQVIKSLKGKTAQYLLIEHADPEEIAALPEEYLHKEIRSKSRGRIKPAQIVKYQEVARETVGVKEGKQSIIREIKHLVEQIQAQDKFISEIEREISDILQKIPASRLIMSIKGIAEITTAAILGETANFANMKNSKQVEKLAGLNLFEISSGKHKGKRRISKRGRSLLRKTLYFGALNVIKYEGDFKEKYQGYLKMGKPKQQALIAIARKLLRVIFALVRDETTFCKNHIQTLNYQKAA